MTNAFAWGFLSIMLDHTQHIIGGLFGGSSAKRSRRMQRYALANIRGELFGRQAIPVTIS